MLIYGIAKDQEGNDYYMVKNYLGKSWKIRRLMVRLKSIRSLQNHEYRSHKNALPKEIAKKLGIK